MPRHGASVRAGNVSLILVVVVAALALAGSAPGLAEERAAPQSLEFAGRTLHLNGYGVRRIAFVEVYDCALYLPEGSANLDYILDADTPSAIRFHIRYSGLPDEPPPAIADSVEAELTAAAEDRYREVYAGLEEGDVMTFAYLPEAGTGVWLNGERLLRDRGHGLMRAILSQWLGSAAKAESLRRKLLTGKNAAQAGDT